MSICALLFPLGTCSFTKYYALELHQESLSNLTVENSGESTASVKCKSHPIESFAVVEKLYSKEFS